MDMMNGRVKKIRIVLGCNQKKFGEAIGLSTSGISNIESGSRSVTEKHIKLICHELNVNEHWLRTGEGDMFVEPDLISLDDYAENAQLSELESNIIKSYLELDKEVRQNLIAHFKANLDKHNNSDS